MIIALFLGIAAAALGWRRAALRGGSRSDCITYALAHGIAAALFSMILMTVAFNMGWLND